MRREEGFKVLGGRCGLNSARQKHKQKAGFEKFREGLEITQIEKVNGTGAQIRLGKACVCVGTVC